MESNSPYVLPRYDKPQQHGEIQDQPVAERNVPLGRLVAYGIGRAIGRVWYAIETISNYTGGKQ